MPAIIIFVDGITIPPILMRPSLAPTDVAKSIDDIILLFII